MIELISSLFKEGDYIKIVFNNSSTSVEGYILRIHTDSIALKKIDGGICGIRGGDINSFEQGSAPQQQEDVLVIMPSEKTSQEDVETSTEKREEKSEEEHANEKAIDSSAEQEKGTGKKVVSQFKPGDVISPEQLDKIDPKLKKRKEKITKGSQLSTIGKGNDFASLSLLVEKEHALENQKVVHALGKIKFIRQDKNYGFIIDAETKKNIYFRLSDIVGEASLQGLTSESPVVYSISKDAMGRVKALTVHRPMSIVAILEMAEKFEKEGKHYHAQNLVNQILKEYPDNYTADEYRRKLNNSYTYNKTKEYTNYFASAWEYKQKKDYPKAIECYLKAIGNNQKFDSAVKDLGWLYVSLYKSTEDKSYREHAIQLTKKYSEELPNNLITMNHLENLYYAAEAYDLFIEVAVKILLEYDINPSRKMILFSKEIVAYMKLGKLNEAKEIVDEALSIDPQNTSVLSLKSTIENNPEDIDEIIAALLPDWGIGGMSKFISDTIDNYEEYAGVHAKTIESKSFNKTTLKDIRKLVDDLGGGRSRERAKYLLTEAKLMTLLEPEDTEKLRSVMARYCNAMALNQIYDHNSLDVTRFYYNEAFALEEKYDANVMQIPVYLLSHCSDYNQLIGMTGKRIQVEYALEMVLEVQNKKLWESILSMMLYNRQISAQITSKLYENKKLKELSLRALEEFGKKPLSPSINKEEFVHAWNVVRDLRMREYNQVTTQINVLGKSSDIRDVCSSLSSLRDIVRDWMTSLDNSRIHTIIENIHPAIEAYINSTGYRNREVNKNNAVAQVKQLIEEIKDGPTKLSYEALLPLLEVVDSLIESSFDNVKKASVPKITIKLLSSETLVNKDNEVSIQISVSNHKDSSPIKEVFVGIIDTDRAETIEGGEILYNEIEGGDRHIFKLKIKVSDDVIKQKATTLEVICKYKSGDAEKDEKEKCSLKLYSATEYEKIKNPYAPFVKGGPVPIDSDMFYGRDEFIANRVDSIINSSSKQIIIYGQKRCGKSSVLMHLKKKLIDTGKTFCVYFSLGELMNEFTEANFYHKILTTISEELENKPRSDNEHMPQFNVPTKSEFKSEDEDNPVNTFMKYMIKFKTLCKQTDGWEDKRLVVMIDEFTYLYTQIKKGEVSQSIMKQWKAITQNERVQFSVVLVGQDVVPSFMKEDYARNAFGVFEAIRLTYLQDKPARELIENPILDSNGKSRYIEGAVLKIIDYTSRNPYYIQIFCSRLVEYMNENQLITVTEADVENVAKTFIEGSEALGEEDFDNLIRAGETEDLQEFEEDKILRILKQISLQSKNIGFCKRSDVHALEDKDEEDKIFAHLTDREVLEKLGDDNYKIQVKLFQEWLLKH